MLKRVHSSHSYNEQTGGCLGRREGAFCYPHAHCAGKYKTGASHLLYHCCFQVLSGLFGGFHWQQHPVVKMLSKEKIRSGRGQGTRTWSASAGPSLLLFIFSFFSPVLLHKDQSLFSQLLPICDIVTLQQISLSVSWPQSGGGSCLLQEK